MKLRSLVLFSLLILSCSFIPAVTVTGKVVGADGKPVPDAIIVSAEGGVNIRARTVARGVFMLTGQPPGKLHLIAASATGSGLATCLQQDKAVCITCTPGKVARPSDIPLAMSWLEADSMQPEKQRRFDLSETLSMIADVDVEQATRCAMAFEPISDGSRAYLLARQAKKDPAKIDELVVQLNLLRDADCKLYAAVAMGIAIVRSEPDSAERLYQIARPIYDRSVHEPESNDIEGLGFFEESSLHTIALAALLHKQSDVNSMLAQVIAKAKQATDYRKYRLPEWLLEAAGYVSPEFVFTVYDRLDDPDKSRYLERAVWSMAEHDPAAALRLSKIIQTRCRITCNMRPLIEAVARKDPAAARSLLKTQNADKYAFPIKGVQMKAEIKNWLQQFFSQESNRTIVNITQANVIDPDFAKALYTKYKTILSVQGYNLVKRRISDAHVSADRARYAYLISSLDPVEARLILETEFARALSKIRQGSQLEYLRSFPLAMCALDLNRAEQMITTISVYLGFRPWLWQQLMRYVLTSREKRVTEPLF